jgi:hypothetical protein
MDVVLAELTAAQAGHARDSAAESEDGDVTDND